MAVQVETLSKAELEALTSTLEIVEQREQAREHPVGLLRHVKCVDSKTGERFEFQLTDPAQGWYWQKDILDWWLEEDKTLVYKARQLGITWLAGGFCLWTALAKPGARCLVFSINESEANKVIGRIYDMLRSLPVHLRDHVEMLKPSRGARPSNTIELRHPDGRVSVILGVPSTSRHGHGETAAVVVLDEFARQEYAADTYKALVPTMAGGGKMLIISTANGVSNPQTGEGNRFHYLWVNSEYYNISRRFLPWSQHPDRDRAWYEQDAMSLPLAERAEQYPANPDEGFIFTGIQFFDPDSLTHYVTNAAQPARRVVFNFPRPDKALLQNHRDGHIRIYKEPVAGRSYAIGADTATGRGTDYSSAFAIDLSTLEFVAEIHNRYDVDEYARDLHFLGRRYNTALIAVEQAGGHGDAVIVMLRDGKDGRPAYPKLYRHKYEGRTQPLVAKGWGYPINKASRPLVLGYLEKLIREKMLPYITTDLALELRTFVHRNTYPSPRAQDGCNDDRVFAAAIACDMYRRYGANLSRSRRRETEYVEIYPWREKQ